MKGLELGTDRRAASTAPTCRKPGVKRYFRGPGLEPFVSRPPGLVAVENSLPVPGSGLL